MFYLANTTYENQIKCALQLDDSTDVIEFIRKKFKDYEVERIQKDKAINSLRGQVSDFDNNLENYVNFILVEIKTKILVIWL